MRRRGVVLMAGVAVVLGIVGLGLRSAKRGAVHSDPAAVRSHSAYAAAYEVRKQRLPEPKQFFESFEFKEGQDEIFVRMPIVAGIDTAIVPIPERTHEARENVVQLEPAGSIALAFVGVLHSAPRSTNPPVTQTFRSGGARLVSGEAPLQRFSEAGRSAKWEDLKVLLPEHRATARLINHYPLGRFYFSASNVPALKPISLQVFDGRTKWPLTDKGSVVGHEGEVFWFDMTFRAWHQTPLELVMTAATGPVKEQTAPVKIGEEVLLDGDRIRVAAMRSGMLVVKGTQADGFEMLTLRTVENGGADDGPDCSVVLQTWQTTAGMQEVEFLDADGEKIPRMGRFKTRNLMVVHLKAEVGSVRSIRLRQQPRIERLVYHLPELPGLPQENRALKNLAEVRVPRVYFGDEYQFENDVRDLLQISGRHVPLRYPNGYFPMERTNVTVGELFLEMERMLKQPDGRLEIDGEGHALTVRKEPIKQMFRRLKLKLGN